MVVALNMMDELTGNQGAIDVNTMEALLGVPVIPISAAKNEGVDELIRPCQYILPDIRKNHCARISATKNDHDGSVHRCIHAVIHLIEDHAPDWQRFRCVLQPTKAIEGDPLILAKLKLDENETQKCLNISSVRWRQSEASTGARLSRTCGLILLSASVSRRSRKAEGKQRTDPQ